MDVNIQKDKDFVIVLPRGEIDAVTCGRLQERIDELIAQGNTKIVLDLNEVTYISSAGLRIILGTAQRLYNEGAFCIARPREEVREILEMVGLTNIIKFYDDLETAKNEFGSN